MTPTMSSATERLTASSMPERADRALEPANAELQQTVRERIRTDCRRRLERCAEDPMYAITDRDVEDWMEAMEEKNLEGPDIRTAEDKTRAVEALAGPQLHDFLRQAFEAGRIIMEAEAKKWILPGKAEEWRRKMKQGTWLEKKEFITSMDTGSEAHTLHAFARNWEKIAEQSKEIRRLEKELGVSKDDALKQEDLAPFHEPSFWGGGIKYPQRLEIVNRALAFLAACKQDRTRGKESRIQGQLYVKAKAQLEDAVKRKVLSATKVGLWLRRIFESKANPELIRKFLNGEGPTPLSTLINNWTEVKRKFDDIEKKRGKEGTPRSFHFVHIDVFLNWNFEKRKAYVEEADHRFIDIRKERYNFLRIRHALDTKDWEEAETLIRVEWGKVQGMTKEDQEKLVSLERFLKTHRPRTQEGKEQRKPTDLEVLNQMRGLMEMIPESQRALHAACLRRSVGAFWVNKVAWYNRVWCREHFRADDEIENRKREEAKEFTPDRVKHGHGRGAEANEVAGATNTDAAVRDQENLNAPQWVVAKRESAATLAKKFDRRQNSRSFWYWTNLLPDGVSYAEHEFVVKNVHPRMMRLAREMDRRGILYTDSGEVQYKQTKVASKKAPVKAPEQSYATVT